MSSPTIRLLLVEDNPADAMLLRAPLAEASESFFEVTHVETMADAVGRLAGDASTRSCSTFRCPTAAG